ncbi:cell division protein FtsK [Rhizocola hellebori]|uniref:Cell division protein FtsK n=1 Tax=Rhizocola hellebori TaxID=1392758 RepID=A0A8J3QFP8_9ACTN|nr:FtsK/SpoIIIE domain-containing protein [Rhizocola hellebori]GIH10128.1 cell division protein FtsK [Rhizocola hellebori]
MKSSPEHPPARGLVSAVRRELAEARQAARAGLAAALAARQAAATQLESVRRSSPARRTALVVTRDEACQEAQARWQRETRALLTALGELAEAAAPGPAGTDFSTWTAQTGPGTEVAGLLRLGTVDTDEPFPALVPLLDAAHLHLSGPESTVDSVVGGLLLRALAGTAPGALRVSIYDPGQLGGAVAGLAPLAPAGLVSYLGPGGLTPLLDELVEHIRRINENVLAGAYRDLAELALRTGRRPEPWRLAVLLADSASELTSAQRAQLDRVVRTGISAGVHVVSRGIDLPPDALVERIEIGARGIAKTSLTGELTVKLDPSPSSTLITEVCKSLAEQVIAGPPPVPFAALLPDQLWSESSAESLRAPVGEGTDGRLVELVLGDDPPHALIGGPSGSGKTNLLYAWLAALATRYPPAELELHLLDFKEGVSFARFAPSNRDPSWLPQVKLVGINVNTDREFGLALLRHLSEELKRRAGAAKKLGATKLSELREEDPAGHWPRIVAVIDEFQVLLAARDAVTSEAVSLLEDLARRGRSQGIHLVLASQDVAGIEALWGRSGLVAQFTLRIALPKARRVLAETNLAAELIPRCHAVVNADSGVVSANTVVRLPDAGDRPTWTALQDQLWQARPADSEPPRLFDGDVPPLFPLLPPPPAAEVLARTGAVALLGETIDVAGRPATLRLNRAPGRNLAVLGSRAEDACAILVSAGLTLARQHAPGSARFSVLCLDDDATSAAKSLLTSVPGASWHDSGNVLALLEDWACDKPHYIFGFAIDAAASVLSGRGHELLRVMLAKGPERRTHLMGWWRTVSRLRDDLGGIGARFDAIGAWVALDVHGNELSALYPKPGGPTWHPRAQRALHFDKAVHSHAEIIMPYEVVP